MSTLVNSYSPSKSNMIVYKIFKYNPFKTFDTRELLTKINKEKQVMSKRTVFRAINKLVEAEKIYCCTINKGTRRFQLLSNNYYLMICEKCGAKIFGEIEDSNIISAIHKRNTDVFIKKMIIEINGICKKCR
ncbi:transcriptional repressor [Maledivibacter halophilus]|uniref:Fe2+ or Zn2+ uptake regulation protein n=1 Tax=Maledivibacter halophilus TaxID=36842 RepID=A0A1T5M063_9FIRM|nr:transcriptional repressor [Maledivibacter halophilus]SKC81239.1 Fe2+ or Zn2+ uptake regulation protein [Maledivibacter halophilus]